MAEHLHCRAKAALFDVSHMGQLSLHGDGAAAALEALVPGDIQALKPGRQRYTLLLNEAGGILDDLMVANYGDRLVLVVNASRKEADAHHLAERLPPASTLEQHRDRALLALQGPAAAAVMARALPRRRRAAVHGRGRGARSRGIPAWISRSGYTGEDGFEISVAADRGRGAGARRCSAKPDVLPAGLGARDSLRLEAGLCLYGNDIDELTTPVEADLAWTIGKRRRAEGDFPGAAPILRPARRRPAPGCASASARTAARRPAPAPRSSPPTAPRPAASPPAASRPRSGRRSPWATSAATSPPPGTQLDLLVRGKPLPAQRRRRCPSSPTATSS